MIINKTDLTESLSLSCVESYFISWIKQFYPIKELYGNSFVSFKKVFDDFWGGVKYENYSSIERLQELAERKGITEHRYLNFEPDQAWQYIKNNRDDNLYLIRVNSKFFDSFKRAAWRADHYVCVDNEGGWINEYPLSEGMFSEKEFKCFFDGNICEFNTCDLKKRVDENCIEQIKKQSTAFKLKNLSIEALESAVGVLRVSRKRLLVFFEDDLNIISLLRKECALLDKLYLNARLYQIKKCKNDESIVNLLKNIQEIECGFIREVKNAK